MKTISLAIVGATGLVGRKFIEVLEERRIPVSEVFLYASAKSEGKTLQFNGKNIPILVLTEEEVRKHPVDFALFSAGSDVSHEFAPIFASMHAVVIDNSSAFRMDPEVPLVVPEVNPEDAFKHHYIIANPNCSTIQAVVALHPLAQRYGLKRVVVSTYQAVSGAGTKGIADLLNHAKTGNTQKFPYAIESNVLPHIDVFLPNGNTKEEEKIIHEMRKIMHLPTLRISSTAVRVPVLNCHSESINLEFASPFDLPEIFSILKKAPGVVVYDDVKYLIYPMPIVVDNHDEVYVGRIRADESVENGLNLFVVGDNIRKGAATNAVQILQLFL